MFFKEDDLAFLLTWTFLRPSPTNLNCTRWLAGGTASPWGSWRTHSVTFNSLPFSFSSLYFLLRCMNSLLSWLHHLLFSSFSCHNFVDTSEFAEQLVSDAQFFSELDDEWLLERFRRRSSERFRRFFLSRLSDLLRRLSFSRLSERFRRRSFSRLSKRFRGRSFSRLSDRLGRRFLSRPFKRLWRLSLSRLSDRLLL